MSETRQHRGPSESHLRAAANRRAHLLDDLREIEAMTDVDLDLEIVALDLNLSQIAADLAAEYDHATERGSQWQVSAEKAAGNLRARRKLCYGEVNRRKVAAAAERRQEAAERVAAERAARGERAAEWGTTRAERRARHEAMVVAARAAKAERLAREAERNQTRQACFVRHAKVMLPAEMFAALWDAVESEMGDHMPEPAEREADPPLP